MATYGERLIAAAIFGSWARGTATDAVRSHVWSSEGPVIELSPVFKTPAELAAGSPLHLDMTLWSVILLDRGGVLESRRVPFKGGAFWDYKPDIRPGEIVEL